MMTTHLKANVDLSKLRHHEIAEIDPGTIYNWIKTGKFSYNRFAVYLNSVKKMSRIAGFDEGSDEGYKEAMYEVDNK